ncbi:hypothetical protein Vretimale_16195 [Volvox reticuliferus]|uniref:peptidyl-tRNA hydrolase n=1 Tax=Volvox reticuliferus TaxID=1737510 RepID=A0A8J4GQJ0_9CHLO|nr:hypothetical protein Vretimale_16195 [Volvox reticuliferus]
MVLDELAGQAGIDCRKLEKSAAVGKGEVQGKQVLLVKPVTFMNNSGESVAALAKFYRVPPNRVLVISDDLDQPVAQVRLRQRGGHGGHNGLRSIIDRMGGTQDFPRIKVNIVKADVSMKRISVGSKIRQYSGSGADYGLEKVLCVSRS